MKKVINELISKSQSTFLAQRQMLDGTVIFNEMVDYAKRFNEKCLILKVEFEKAYEKVSWEYIRFMIFYNPKK